MKKLSIIVYSCILSIFASCSLYTTNKVTSPTLDIDFTPVSTLEQLPTPTKTEIAIPTNTPQIVAIGNSCNPDHVIKKLKSEITYVEFELYFNVNVVNDISSLVVWFVDPLIDPEAQEDSIYDNFLIALDDAVLLSIQLIKSDECVNELFTHVNPIAVDRNYNG